MTLTYSEACTCKYVSKLINGDIVYGINRGPIGCSDRLVYQPSPMFSKELNNKLLVENMVWVVWLHNIYPNQSAFPTHPESIYHLDPVDDETTALLVLGGLGENKGC